MFNNLIDRFHNTINVHEINIIEDLTTDITTSIKEDILDQGEDTLTFLGNYVEQADTKLDKQKLKKTIKEYKESIACELYLKKLNGKTFCQQVIPLLRLTKQITNDFDDWC